MRLVYKNYRVVIIQKVSYGEDITIRIHIREILYSLACIILAFFAFRFNSFYCNVIGVIALFLGLYRYVKLTFEVIKGELKRMKNSKGFTLVELLVVIAVIGILVASLLVSLGKKRDRTEESSYKTDFTGCIEKCYQECK